MLERHDVRLIADEVICGFGRLGTMFGSQRLGMTPHTISVAKAITSAYMPLGAVMLDEPMYEAMLAGSREVGTFGHGFTYSGHPTACAVALKTLEIYERDRIVEGVAAKEPQFLRRLAMLEDHPLVGEARGIGLIAGLELVADKATKQQYDPKSMVAAKAIRLLPGGGPHPAQPDGRPHRHLPAADHHAGGDRRALRQADPGLGSHAGLGEGGWGEGAGVREACASSPGPAQSIAL